MRKIIFITFSCIILMSVLPINQSNLIYAYDFETQSGLEDTAIETGHYQQAISTKSPAQIFGGFIKIFLSFLGVIFLLLMIYSGYLWMMAGGNESQVGKAKSIIKHAIFGLTIVLAAYAITVYITNSFFPGAV